MIFVYCNLYRRVVVLLLEVFWEYFIYIINYMCTRYIASISYYNIDTSFQNLLVRVCKYVNIVLWNMNNMNIEFIALFIRCIVVLKTMMVYTYIINVRLRKVLLKRSVVQNLSSSRVLLKTFQFHHHVKLLSPYANSLAV